MRAQVTVEYLLLSAIALALMSFSVLALAHIRDSSERAYGALLFKSSATDLGNAMDEACALGSGNSRTVYVKRAVDVSGGTRAGILYAQFTDARSGLSLSRKMFCPVDGADSLFGKVEVKNEGGSVSAAQSP
jgi:hypothetical protein